MPKNLEVTFKDEKELGAYLASIVILAENQGFDAEHALIGGHAA